MSPAEKGHRVKTARTPALCPSPILPSYKKGKTETAEGQLEMGLELPRTPRAG